MANEQNLIPNNKRTPSERRENAKKAGVASGEARRRKKSMKQTMEYLLSLPISNDENREIVAELGIDPDDVDNQMVVMVAALKKASKGNVDAMKFIASITGSTPMTENERAKNKLTKKRIQLQEKEFEHKKEMDDNEWR